MIPWNFRIFVKTNDSTMERLFAFLVAVCCLSIAASAQYTDDTQSILRRKRAGLTLDGQKLSAEEQAQLLSDIGGLDYTEQWNRYARGRRTGIALISVGAATAAAGAAVVAGTGLVYVVGLIIVAPVAGVSDNGDEVVDDYGRSFRPWFTGGFIALGAGAAVAVAGIPVTVKNCRRMNGIVDRYNEEYTQPAAELAFGATGNGIGLMLRF